MLLLRISVIAPVVESNSIGTLHFLKKVSLITLKAESLAVPLPPRPCALMLMVLSISVRNLLLLARLLKLW